MDSSDSMHGVPPVERYKPEGSDRYFVGTGSMNGEHRPPGGFYCSTPTTLEEEAAQGGWTKVNRPEGPDYRILTTSMRGDPDYDDDLEPDYTGTYKDTPSGDADY